VRILAPNLWLALLGALWLSAGLADATSDTPPVHTVLTLPLGQRSPRVHRFQLPLSQQLKVDVVDLHYETPLADALGDADLIVNGGYWGWGNDSKRRIIGLLSAGGKEWSPLRAALDGGVFVLHGGKASVSASRGYQGPAQPDLAVQCSPRLVQSGALIPNLKASGRAARTAVCVRDAGNTLDVYLTEPDDLGPNLSDFARWLLAQGCEHALNLDGGPSTAAGFRDHGKLVRIGSGEALPYALRFKYGK
jgi:hypothetical protein